MRGTLLHTAGEPDCNQSMPKARAAGPFVEAQSTACWPQATCVMHLTLQLGSLRQGTTNYGTFCSPLLLGWTTCRQSLLTACIASGSSGFMSHLKGGCIALSLPCTRSQLPVQVLPIRCQLCLPLHRVFQAVLPLRHHVLHRQLHKHHTTADATHLPGWISMHLL